ncbi:MAG: F0F1 ATP synthase subunit B [Microscillaceae bacterium]|nr:F0F1 ATP synthase subunit B [Microscillaceae bacterium]
MDLVTPGFGLIFWQTITFLVVLFLLSRYAWKPITQALKDREHSIEEALHKAEQAKEEMRQLQANNEQLLDDARLEREKMLKSAQQAAIETREEAKRKAQEEVGKMIEEARRTIETEKESALVSIRQQIAMLSIDIAEKVLQRELSDANAQKKMVSDLINDLKIN